MPHYWLPQILLLQATEELRARLEKLKTMYGSGIKSLHNLAGELDDNTQSTFGHLDSEVTMHSLALEEVDFY